MIKDQITYDSRRDLLRIKVDELPEDPMGIITTQPYELIVDVTFNVLTGGLLEFDITGLKSNFDGDPPEGLRYNPDEDTLYIKLHPDDQEDSPCDMVFLDVAKEALVTLNRNNVGNLTGIEIIGLEKIFEIAIDIREDQVR